MQMLSPDERPLVRRVLLFGSAARGDTHAESDVDLFVDTDHAARLEPRVRALVADFEASVKVTRYWQLVGVHGPLSIQVAALDPWSSLHLALLKDGRVLYGPYTEHTPSLGPARALIAWRDVPERATRTNLYRSLYGYTSRDRDYPGLLEKLHAETISKGSALVPLSALGAFQALFRKLRVPLKMRVLYEPAASPATAGPAATVARNETRKKESDRATGA